MYENLLPSIIFNTFGGKNKQRVEQTFLFRNTCDD